MRWAKQIVQEGFRRPDAEFVAFKAMFGEGSLVMLRHRVNSVRPSWCSHGISTEKQSSPPPLDFCVKVSLNRVFLSTLSKMKA